MISWNYFSKRRNVNLVDYIKSRDIENYNQLTEALASKGVNAPEKGEFQSAYAIAFPPVPKVKKTPAAAKPKTATKAQKPKPRTVRKKAIKK